MLSALLLSGALLTGTLPFTDDFVTMLDTGEFVEESVDDSFSSVSGGDADDFLSSDLGGSTVNFDLSQLDLSGYIDGYLENSLMAYSAYQGYGGSIGSSYLEFFRGYLTRLKPSDHYVLFRESQYVYTLAMGNLSYDGYFHGDVTLYKYNSYDYGSLSVSHDYNFSLTVGSGMVYTDLSDSQFPALATFDAFTSRQILYVLVGGCIGWVLINFFKRR